MELCDEEDEKDETQCFGAICGFVQEEAFLARVWKLGDQATAVAVDDDHEKESKQSSTSPRLSYAIILSYI